jgi:hypothetical protein
VYRPSANSHAAGQPPPGLTINPNNINSYREVLSEVRSPHVQLAANDFAIPMIGAFPSSVTNAGTVGGGLVPALPGHHKRNKYVGNAQG